MSKTEISEKKSFSLDWLVQGVLTKVGDLFDNLTGRKWKPSSSLATSELVERLKKLLDLEVKDLGQKGKFVPHNLELKMQWDKFSTDAEQSLKKLETELLIAAVDHINDNRYQTYAPLKLRVKPDYFTEGVKLFASFDHFGENGRDAEMNVTVPEIKVGNFAPQPEAKSEQEKTIYTAEFMAQGKTKKVELKFAEGQRISVGRTRENGLSIEDKTISKIHAALVLSSEGVLQVADTGSTNGTFINDQRIAYGKAYPVSDADTVRFGTIDVLFKKSPVLSEEGGEAIETDEEATVLSTSREFLLNAETGKIDEDKFRKSEFSGNEKTLG
jgi:hypothetical protein